MENLLEISECWLVTHRKLFIPRVVHGSVRFIKIVDVWIEGIRPFAMPTKTGMTVKWAASFEKNLKLYNFRENFKLQQQKHEISSRYLLGWSEIEIR
jgi:hypothetical protein